MQRSKKLLQLANLAIACTLFLAIFISGGQFSRAIGGLTKVTMSPKQLLEQMTFSQRVTLVADGEERQLLTSAHTVSDAISFAGLSLGPWDRTEPALNATISDQQVIRLVRVDQQLVEEQAVVPFRTVKVPSRLLSRGESKEVRPGVNGKQVNTYQVLLENGKPVKRELVKAVVLVEKQDRVVEEGVISTLSRGGENYRYSKKLNVSATAYTADYNPAKKAADDPWLGMTSSGKKATPGLTIAVDPRVIPMGSRVYVEGIDATGKRYNGIYVAMDTGGAIKGNIIDIFMKTHSECMSFGRRKMVVYILE